MRHHESRLLQVTLERLKTFESETTARLTRVEENLRLLRLDLMGDAQPGRISRVEGDVAELRAEYHRQRGIFAAISVVVSAAVAFLSRFLYRP